MYEDLLPTGLTAAARHLGVEPLEIVRLMVLSDTVTPGFQVSKEHLAKLGALGGIERGWWDGVALPEDSSPARSRVRAALQMLLARSGNGPVRMDNLWRGLPIGDQALIEEALNLLADEEIVTVENADMGVVVSVPSANVEQLRALGDGTGTLDALEPLFHTS